MAHRLIKNRRADSSRLQNWNSVDLDLCLYPPEPKAILIETWFWNIRTPISPLWQDVQVMWSNAPVNWTPPPPGQHRLSTSIDQKYCPWGWGIWQILTPHMSTPGDNVGLLTRSAVLTRMGTLALNMIWVTSPSINTMIFFIQGSVIYLQSSLVVYVVLFNNKICCFKKSCFLLYHKSYTMIF